MAQDKTPEELARNRRAGGFLESRHRLGDGRLVDTYALFSGGRAVSENLQLDRTVQGTKPEEATVDIDTLDGITVPEIDWKPLIKDLKPELDPLAASIPADQHVVFFPTFSAAVLTADQAEIQGTPILHLAEPRSEDARTAERYQRQLCLSLTRARPAAGPEGGEERGPDRLRSVLPHGHRRGRVVRGRKARRCWRTCCWPRSRWLSSKTPGAKPEQGEIDGLAYRGVRSPDRSVCSYVARLDQAVVVTNSLYQLERLAARGQEEVAVDRLAARVHVLPRPLPAGRRGGDGVAVLERRDDPPLVRPEVANRHVAAGPRHGRAGRIAGGELGPAGEEDGPARADLHRFRHGRGRRAFAGRGRRSLVGARLVGVHDPDRRVAAAAK